MRLDKVSLFAALIATAWVTQTARADQPRDWMVAAQPAGTYANLDVIFPGMQATLEHRISIYGKTANELDFKINALPTAEFYESQADVDLRILFLSLGASAGFRDVFHNLEFAPYEKFDRAARRDKEFGGYYDNALTGYGEGRVTLSLPFNDHLVLLSVNGLRFEGGRDRTFDWRLGIVRDAGMLLRSDTTLFVKGASWGAFGPHVQVLNYAMNGVRNTQINYGFTFTTRPGLRNRNDIFFLSMLFGVGGTINDGGPVAYPTGGVYGAHLFLAPLTFELAYRAVLEISGPSKSGDPD
jgi:hypothetical protein